MRATANRILPAAALYAAAGVLLLRRLFNINADRENYMSYDLSAPRNVTVVSSYGEIFDRNGKRLVNRGSGYIAVIDPETADRRELDPHITDREKFDSCIDGKALFLCGVDTPDLKSVTVIPVSGRYSEGSFCSHIIGYRSGEEGIYGIEKAYGKILGQPANKVTLSYSTDAGGDFLEGKGIDMRWVSSYETGVCLSIDRRVQIACEHAMRDVEKGAAVVMDISTGELCAVVSRPAFDPAHPEYSLDDENSPFVNRAFSAYSIGSIFKLITAGAALEYGISEEYAYDCTGSIYVRGQKFDCHRFGGHGRLDMRKAMSESCNPYFISLGSELSAEYLHDFAEKAGIGRGSALADGLYSADGNLPKISDLLVPAEKANFSFGQGKVTATPLQITMLTAAIAAGGQCPEPVLVNGAVNLDRDCKAAAASPRFRRVMEGSTARMLKSFMISAMYKENSAAVPEFTTGGGKTSTAQTWLFDENGNEKLNCWFTGFFPADEPKYAVTVLIEEGVSGNLTCGPVFKEIADSVRMERYKDD